MGSYFKCALKLAPQVPRNRRVQSSLPSLPCTHCPPCAAPPARRQQDAESPSATRVEVRTTCQTRGNGTLIGIECSRVRDSSWMYLTSFVTTRIGVELAAVQRKLPDRVVVGLQLYSARYPLKTHQHQRQYKPPQRT